MSDNLYGEETLKNGKDISFIPISKNFVNKCLSKRYKNKTSLTNKRIINNKKETYSQITLNNENMASNETSKYIHCKRHPQNNISYFCENDKKFPCLLCISQHENHSYKKFFCTKDYFENEILALKKLYKENEIKYIQNKKRAEIFFSKIKNHFDKEMNKIKDYFDSMISILQDKKNEFIAKMLIIYENYIQKFIKYKFIFDFCDKNIIDLCNRITYIENEIYKKEDLESLYQIKNIFINEINIFYKYNEEHFSEKNIFYFNEDLMPIFVYPEKQIINVNDNINLFGSFKNTNLGFNQEENSYLIMLLDKNKIKQNIDFFDSLYQDDEQKKDNNILKRNKTNLEMFLEKNKNINIFSSINSGISNINDSFINKQLIDTNSTLLFLNKNEVKNVFKQQDVDISQKFDKIETQINNNKDIKLPDSPKIKNKNFGNKIKYTSCNREKRNKQIIKKFLEKKYLKNNEMPRLTAKQSKKNIIQKIDDNSKNLTFLENGSINNTLNDEYFNIHKRIRYKTKNNKKCENRNKKIKQNYPPNNGIRFNQIPRNSNRSFNKNINNSKNKLNNHSFNLELKNNIIINKRKNSIINKTPLNNINKYFINNSFEEMNINNDINYDKKNIRRRFNDFYSGFYRKSQIKRNSLIRNHINIRSMKHIRNIKSNHNNSMFDDKILPHSQISRITDNFQRRNSFSNHFINRYNVYKNNKTEFNF